MKRLFRRRDCADLPARADEAPRRSWRWDLRRESLYMTLWTFLFSVIVAAGVMAAAAYGFLVFFGLLVNPLFRTLPLDIERGIGIAWLADNHSALIPPVVRELRNLLRTEESGT